MAGDNKKGRVCVTGGTGYLGSWMIKRLLEDGYSVNTTTRIDPERKRDISFLTNLPGASDRLHIFNADLDNPDSFSAAIEGCVGVFHVAHPLDFEERETEEVKVKRVTAGLRGILQACADSKTVRRVVYTSSITAAVFDGRGLGRIIGENCWSDPDLVRSMKTFLGPYIVTKTLAEKAALDFAGELGLDLVTVLPTWITGPFVTAHWPDTVYLTMSLILGGKGYYQHLKRTTLVHADDVVRAHIHLFEYPEAKGRYICAALEIKIQELCDFISLRYPEYKEKMPTEDAWKDLVQTLKFFDLSTEKLKDTGFKYENGLEEIFDGAIESCKEKGLL